jgi:excisionase family DNA binding protein
MSWMTTDESAAHTKMHRQVIARAAASGELHGYQRTEPRGRWRFRVECLDAWVAGEPCEHQTPTRRLRVS